jgi:hypothetical protein
MMTLKQELLHEIQAIESRIALLGLDPSVRKRWDLAGGKLRVVLGSDNECYTRDQDTNEYLDESDKADAFLEHIFKACAAELTEEPAIDSSSLELNPNPGNATALIKCHNKLARDVKRIAKAFAIDFAMGAGHWHISLEDLAAHGERRFPFNAPDHEGEYRSEGSNEDPAPYYTALAHMFADNLIALQCECPALFLRPSRSEKPKDARVYTERLVHNCARSGTIQMNADTYPTGARMFEMRIATLAPYVPVLMMLHALERTLKGERIEITQGLNPGDKFLGGRGRYLDYIKATVRSTYLSRFFPTLRDPLIKKCVESYIGYLRTPAWAVEYTTRQRQAQIKQVAEIFAGTAYAPWQTVKPSEACHEENKTDTRQPVWGLADTGPEPRLSAICTDYRDVMGILRNNARESLKRVKRRFVPARRHEPV